MGVNNDEAIQYKEGETAQEYAVLFIDDRHDVIWFNAWDVGLFKPA